MNVECLDDKVVRLVQGYLRNDEPEKAFRVMLNWQYHGANIAKALRIYQDYWNEIKKEYGVEG